MATATATTKALRLTCPNCGSSDDGLTLALEALPRCTCNGCSHEFEPSEAIERLESELAKWRAVATWISLAPEID